MAAPDDTGAPTGTEHDDGARKPTHRRLLIAGIAVLAVLALVALPLYLATRPAYYGRFPGLADEYATWSTSTHADAPCRSCHVPPGVLSRSLNGARLLGAFYLSLVPGREPSVFATPTNEACVVCHSDLRTVSPEGDLRIPHRAHISILKMDCIDCHAYLVHAKSPEGEHTPPMSGCMTCHDGDTAKDDCSACHTQKDAPKSHRAADWLVVHGPASKGSDCAKCHKFAKDWCAECHSQRPRSHGPDWRSAHGGRVAEHRGCEACHAAAFCVRCHGEVPKLGFDPAVKLVR